MELTNKQYDIAKRIVIQVVPALIALITGLGALYKVDVSLITGTIALFATFAGTVLGVSSKKYNESTAQEDDLK